jgi:hypothetical protein
VDQVNPYRGPRHCNTRPRLTGVRRRGETSLDTGNTRPSYYDKNGWHFGLPPEARAALAGRGQHSGRPQNDWFWGGSRY